MRDQLSDQELLREFNRLGFITRSPSIGPLLRRAQKTAEVSDITVLIKRDWNGKQVLANGIHQLDKKRNSFPFVTVLKQTSNDWSIAVKRNPSGISIHIYKVIGA
jgi:DNA-binding NtrC family response regulator